MTVNTYNPLGEVQKATLGNGIVRNLVYDNRGRVTSDTEGSIYGYSLGYAPDSNILSSGNDPINGSWTYSYDDFNRLSGSNKNNGVQTFSYVYDRYSNRWQQNAPQGGPAPQYTFNGNNQITTASGVLYDAAGNVTNDGLGNTYTYDAENRVISMSGTNSASYVYDAFGRRVRTTVNATSYDFIFNGTQAVDKFTASPWGLVWAHPGGAPTVTFANSSTYFDHTDWTGTARSRSGPTGSTAETCTSLAFGDALACNGGDYSPSHYTGQTLDAESNLHHFLARQLSTTQGRWTASDPAGLAAVDPSNPQTWNRYAYVANNPLSFTDSLGLNQDACGPHSACGPNGAPGSSSDPGFSFSPGGTGGVFGSALGGMFFNATQYDFSGGPNFQWDNFSLSDLLTFADQGEISLDAVTSLGVFGFGGSGQGSDSPFANGGTGALSPKAQQCLNKVLSAAQNALGQPVNYIGPTQGSGLDSNGFRNGAYNFDFFGAGYAGGGAFNICGRYVPGGIIGTVTGIGPSLHIVSPPGPCNPAGDPTSYSMNPAGFMFTAHIDSAFGYNPIGFIWHEIVDVLLKRNHGC